MTQTTKTHEFYGYKMVQNQSNKKLALYMGAINAEILRDIVSVDNAVKWDPSSSVWRERGRNRVISDAHWQAIKEFLDSDNRERILPSAIVISVEEDAFEFRPFPKMQAIDEVVPGTIRITGKYKSVNGELEPVKETERTAWVLDGQHRIKAFRVWSMPAPYPMNVTIIKAWKGPDYEDAMRHQTYELNMGRELSEDFKAAVREQYNEQIGHKAYKREIALSWIRKDVEGRGLVLGPKVVGATNLRVPFVIKMGTIEKVIKLAFEHDTYLDSNYTLEKMDKKEVREVGKYLYDFFEGVRLSIGLINPNVKGTIGPDPETAKAKDYWDIALTTDHKQRLLHNVGLKALVRGLLNKVMRSDKAPQNPQEVADLLGHMRGIPWHQDEFQSKKDDWVPALADALGEMYDSKGTSKGNQRYQMKLRKKDRSGNEIDDFTLVARGWTS